MKHIRFLIIACCFLPLLASAQFEVRDPTLATLKGTVALELGLLDGQKALIESAYKRLGPEEEKFHAKLRLTPDTRTATIYFGTQIGIIFLNNRISVVNSRITTLEAIPIPLRRHWGLKALKGELERERVYLTRISDDMSLLDIAALSPRATGGSGYAYTYVLKISLRFARIRSKVKDIEYRVNNLNTLTKIIF